MMRTVQEAGTTPTAESSAGADRTRSEDRRALAGRIALVIALLAIATVAQLLRERGRPPWDVIQSDDGGFLVPAWRDSPLSLLWTSYAGYLNLPQRLIASPLVALPRAWGAAYIAVTSCVLTAVLGWFVAVASRGLIRQPALRWLLGFILVFTPAMGHETMGALAQQQYPLVFAAFWAVISTQRSRPMVVARSLVVFFACTGSPLALAFVPLAIGVAYVRRNRADVVVAIALGVGGLLQGIAILVVPTPAPLAARTYGELPGIYGQRILGSWLVGERWLERAWLDLGANLSILATLAAIALVVVFAACTQRSQWVWAAIALVWSGGFLAGSLTARGLVPLLQAVEGIFHYDGARYMLVPFWLFVSALVLLAGGPRTPVPRWLSQLATAGCIVLVAQTVVLAAAGYRITNIRSSGPSYAAQLRRADAACLRDPHAHPIILFAPPLFRATVSCEDL